MCLWFGQVNRDAMSPFLCNQIWSRKIPDLCYKIHSLQLFGIFSHHCQLVGLCSNHNILFHFQKSLCWFENILSRFISGVSYHLFTWFLNHNCWDLCRCKKKKKKCKGQMQKAISKLPRHICTFQYLRLYEIHGLFKYVVSKSIWIKKTSSSSLSWFSEQNLSHIQEFW